MTSKKQDNFQDDWGFFTQIPDIFIEQSQVLTNQARWLFVILRFHTNKKSKNAFPSYETLQAETGWANKTISKAIKDLEKHGWLTRKKGFGENTQYRLVRKHSPSQENVTEVTLIESSPLQRNAQSVPWERSVLSSGTSTYKELTYTELTQKEHEDLNYSRTHNLSCVTAESLNQQPISSISRGSQIASPQVNQVKPVPIENTHHNLVREGADTHAAQGALFASELPVLISGCNGLGSGRKIDPSLVSDQNSGIPGKGRTLRKPVSEIDPRSNHPAIQALRELAEKYPKKILYDQIIEILGDNPDKVKLADCYREAVKRGCNGNAWYWVDWYRDGIPELSFGKHKKQKEVSKYGGLDFNKYRKLGTR